EKAILNQDPSLDLAGPAESPAPERAILIAPLGGESVDALFGLAVPLASEPAREVIAARVLEADEQGDLARATDDLRERRDSLLSEGVSARVAAFTSSRPGEDIVRLATEQSVDLVLVDAAPGSFLGSVGEVLRASPADVAVLTGHLS